MEDNIALAEGMNQMWNWLCGRCGWRGVGQVGTTFYQPDQIQDIGWHKGNNKYHE